MPQQTQPIRFLLNDRIVEVSDVPPTTSVLTYLREHSGLTGTKEGCAEGDCGACTVVVATLKQDRLELAPVNACIQFVPTLDGKALFTVEYLRTSGGDLHPVQQAMVECHGSQCGFCTPGFVMSLWGLYLESSQHHAAGIPTEQTVRQAITGNLCRCTGYRPIIEAGKRMFELPAREFDRGILRKALESLRRSSSLQYHYRGSRFFAPRTLRELTALRAAKPTSVLLAGGTDVGLWVNKQFRELGEIIYIGEIAELQVIAEDEAQIRIGAAVSLNDAYEALKKYYPQMNELWERFASAPIRNAGTLGGNLANGSPIGDAMPSLIALGATVTLASAKRTRRLPLDELYVAYQQKAMEPAELLAFIEIPKPGINIQFRTYKISKRFDSDISAVCAAFAIALTGNIITQARVAYGGMAATPKRARKTESVLLGRAWEPATVHDAMVALATDFTPLTDMRASAQYRLTVAQNLLNRYYLETRGVDALPAGQLSVFA